MGKLKLFEIRGGFNARGAMVVDSAPPLSMRVIAPHVQNEVLKRETHDSLRTVCLPDREEDRREAC